MSADFLMELGTEELPPKAIFTIEKHFKSFVTEQLVQARLTHDAISVYVSPRRFAVKINNLQVKQEDQKLERKGPMVAAAFDKAGKPTPAGLGFARSCQVEIEDLEQVETNKGLALFYRGVQAGKETVTLLPELMQKAIAQLNFARPMRWASHSHEFIRPVHWLLMIFGGKIVPAELFGKISSNHTFGHRFHHPSEIMITDANQYEDILLKEGNVIVDFTKRRTTIDYLSIAVSEQVNCETVIDTDLLDEVTCLVEWPVPLLAKFDDAFLRVPKEALIAAMHGHQKCFHVETEQGELAPYFVTVSNIDSKDQNHVVAGNEKVMQARLSDAAFFYDMDLKASLEARIPRLQTVTFQTKLGSLHDKSVRLASLAHDIAALINADSEQASRAGLLAKCDLVSDMVGEFPELQGIMGKYYALNDKEPEPIAMAIEEHYHPRFAQDTLPSSKLGAALALADRLDNLVGIFAIGEIPTGDKDPYALRRGALGLVRIIIENEFHLNIDELLTKAKQAYGEHMVDKDINETVIQFINERLKAYYRERGIAPDVISSVLARQTHDLYDFHRRVLAVQAFRELNQAEALAAANKRVSNILRKESFSETTNGIDASLLKIKAEQILAKQLEAIQLKVTPMFQAGHYQEALTELATLREAVDNFFDEVMVMDEDLVLRKNRLLLLSKLRHVFLQVADISLLQ